MKEPQEEDRREDYQHEEFGPKRESLRGEYPRVAPGNKHAWDEPVISEEPVGWNHNSEFSQVPSGRAMHQFAGGILISIFMLMLVGMGAYVIYRLMQTFDGYLQEGF
ncbi:hypothetical protein [Rubinisphaera margarita]|uniref:hypothetical protein n=1 Tax=Rubinisphaera margarita TaxID=2909586 RepID=UPI001EE805A4|nr:hypothetical protein [Rubinisphaera margarita]MCG6158033.1 hypothetical protein [Rubinisphaera margarita]